ncbi:MAG: hypothetical protein GY845_30030 [Planctomycetes bacterium]|nr:hypothetical protein [Planctomycetota bacterium]
MYRHLSLLRLVELIAHKSDRKALQEFHNNRSVFYYHNNQPLHLTEFTNKLRQSKPAWRWCNGNAEILEEAYDLTISKFSNLPDLKKNDRKVKQEGPNCRYYYEAFLKHAAKKIETEFYNPDDDREQRVAELLQKLIVRHFRLSCYECSRKSRGLKRRYLWKVNGHTIPIILPIEIHGRQRGKWLADNIPDVNPARPGERDRVQAIVDNLAVKRKIFSLEHIEKNAIAADLPSFQPEIEQEITAKGLADAVADEKAENIEFQRDSIQRLGKRKLRRLIRKVFDSLACGQYEVVKIAKSFGINQTTFSRFAGSKWLTQAGKSRDCPIPDLWVNTAQTLAGHSVFIRVAEDAGILEGVEAILRSNNARKRNGA